MSSETHECRDTGGNSYDLRGGLFRQMNTKDQARGGRFQGVPCFNGGLFADIHPLELTPAEIRILAEAADFDWSLVKPEIFRTLFQSSMDADECHAFGAHITSEFDIRKVVGQTIVRPWREKLEAPGTSSASSRKFSAISCKLPGYLNCALVSGVSLLDNGLQIKEACATTLASP